MEIHVSSTLLTELARCPDLPHRWAGLVADLAHQHTRQIHDSDPDELDGQPHARHPHAGLRRHIQLRDRSCVAPGCRRPAGACAQDHTIDYHLGGRTIRANLDPLCTKHHAMKHHGGWRLDQPQPGRYRWRSPLGRVYCTRGEPIAPDLPEPIDRGPDDPDPDTAAGLIIGGPVLSIFSPPPATPPPVQAIEPPPPEDDDEQPPF